MESKENGLSAFSDETLDEMGMENLEGGVLDGNTVNKSCPTNTNCPCPQPGSTASVATV